jgi:hypothetical protein
MEVTQLRELGNWVAFSDRIYALVDVMIGCVHPRLAASYCTPSYDVKKTKMDNFGVGPDFMLGASFTINFTYYKLNFKNCEVMYMYAKVDKPDNV